MTDTFQAFASMQVQKHGHTYDIPDSLNNADMLCPALRGSKEKPLTTDSKCLPLTPCQTVSAVCSKHAHQFHHGIYTAILHAGCRSISTVYIPRAQILATPTDTVWVLFHSPSYTSKSVAEQIHLSLWARFQEGALIVSSGAAGGAVDVFPVGDSKHIDSRFQKAQRHFATNNLKKGIWLVLVTPVETVGSLQRR